MPSALAMCILQCACCNMHAAICTYFTILEPRSRSWQVRVRTFAFHVRSVKSYDYDDSIINGSETSLCWRVSC